MYSYVRDFEGMLFTKNNDGTYKGNKETDIYDKATNNTYKAFLEYPKLRIKWVDDIEFGNPEIIEAMPASSVGTAESDDTLWSLTIPD